MSNKLSTLPKSIIYLFFIIGILSAFAFRALIFVQYYDPKLGRGLWYFAVIGYIFFFLYRYKISQKRKAVIKEYDMIKKLKNDITLSREDREAMLYIISSLEKSRENYNYYIIFILSIVAILLDLILHFYGI